MTKAGPEKTGNLTRPCRTWLGAAFFHGFGLETGPASGCGEMEPSMAQASTPASLTLWEDYHGSLLVTFAIALLAWGSVLLDHNLLHKE